MKNILLWGLGLIIVAVLWFLSGAPTTYKYTIWIGAFLLLCVENYELNKEADKIFDATSRIDDPHLRELSETNMRLSFIRQAVHQIAICAVIGVAILIYLAQR